MEDEDKLLYGDDGGGEKDVTDEPNQGGSGDTAQDEDTVTFPEENAVKKYFYKAFPRKNIYDFTGHFFWPGLNLA